jgi:hypothetical protein
MPSDNTTALIVAGISGVVSVIAAGVGERARRRTAVKLADQAKDLEAFKDALERSREAETKAAEAERLVARYRDPLLRSAFDLQTSHAGSNGSATRSCASLTRSPPA